MEGFYYLGMLVGLIWLCVWACFPQFAKRYPSPFDMAGDTEHAYVERPRRGRGQRAVAAETAPSADVQHALSEPRAAESWRVRGEQAAASGRQRRS
jgi:hypothetical protein